MAFFLKAFYFVVYSLVIYSCLEYKIAKIEAKDPTLGENENKVRGQERNILILNEKLSDVSSYHKQLKTETESKDGGGEAESYTIDDEDGDREGSGEDTDMQGDEPAVPSNDGDGPSLNKDPKLNSSSTRSPEETLTANSTALATPTASLSSPTFNAIGSTRALYDDSATSFTPPLITAHASFGVLSTIGIDTSAFMSVEISVRASGPASVLPTRETRTSTVAVGRFSSIRPIEPTSKQPKTIETTTKEGNNVQSQKEPSPKMKEKKTLFGFVTIEILVALLAGAACAVILLVFLVHRLKKRNEGSYELQETLMLKSGGYAEEKEVFV